MPKIPRYEARKALPSGGGVRLGVGAATAVPRAIAGAGRSISQLGDVAFRIGEAFRKAKQTRQVSEQSTVLANEINNLQLNYEQRAEIDINQFATDVQRITEARLKAIGDKEVADIVRIRGLGYAGSATRAITRASRVKDQKVANAVLFEKQRTNAKLAATAHDDEARQDYIDEYFVDVDKFAARGLIGADDVVRKKQSFMAELEINEIHELILSNPREAIRAIKDPAQTGNISQDILRRLKDRAKAAIKAQEIEVERKEAKAKKLEDEAEIKAIAQWEGDALARFPKMELSAPEVMALPNTPRWIVVKTRWLNNLTKQTDAINKGKKDPFEVDVPKTVAEMWTEIHIASENFETKEDILDKYHGKGVSTNTVNKGIKEWTTKPKDPTKTARAKRGFTVLKNLETDGVYDTDEKKNILIWNQKTNQLEQWIEDNPDASDAAFESYIEQLVEVEKRNWVLRLFDTFSEVATGEMAVRAARIVKTVKTTKKRERAIRELKMAGMPITEANIENAMQQIEAE